MAAQSARAASFDVARSRVSQPGLHRVRDAREGSRGGLLPCVRGPSTPFVKHTLCARMQRMTTTEYIQIDVHEDEDRRDGERWRVSTSRNGYQWTELAVGFPTQDAARMVGHTIIDQAGGRHDG